ncbi:MAG: ABC transporter ATP-binding protein [Hyphomicrobiales bacterium]
MASAERSQQPAFSHAVEMSQVRFSWGGAHAFSIEIDAFSVGTGETVLLLGPSGAGKSTLLSLLCGVVQPSSGEIKILGTSLAGLAASERDHFRAEHFGIIFQMFNLLPYATAMDNVLLPLHFAPERRKKVLSQGKGDASSSALALLSGLHIDEAQAQKTLASELSVGQQQRVAAARALIGTPDIIVADEPTSALDTKSQNAFLDMLFESAGEAGSTLIFVSHDERLAKRFKRVIRLEDIAKIERGGVE